MTKEEFNWFWKDTTKEGVLNQFYYEHIQLREEIEKINKAIEYIENNSLYETEYDYDYEENSYLSGIDDEIAKKDLLEILKGED